MAKMYDELASWWPLLSAPSDYEEEAGFYRLQLQQACLHPVRTLLELGSGGGNNASHMKRGLRTTLVEPSAGMRTVSLALNPDCEHVAGDMRTVRLGRQFDAVFVHDAVMYMATATDLQRAMDTAWAHCAPGGVVLFAPDCVAETFRSSTDHGGHDGDARGVRYLEWTWDPDPSDSTYTVDYALMLREADGTVRVEHDRHVEGLFRRTDWLGWMRDVGLVARSVPFAHSEVAPDTLEVFVGVRPEQR